MDGIFEWIQSLPTDGPDKPHAAVAGAGFIGLEMMGRLIGDAIQEFLPAEGNEAKYCC